MKNELENFRKYSLKDLNLNSKKFREYCEYCKKNDNQLEKKRILESIINQINQLSIGVEIKKNESIESFTNMAINTIINCDYDISQFNEIKNFSVNFQKNILFKCINLCYERGSHESFELHQLKFNYWVIKTFNNQVSKMLEVDLSDDEIQNAIEYIKMKEKDFTQYLENKVYFPYLVKSSYELGVFYLLIDEYDESEKCFNFVNDHKNHIDEEYIENIKEHMKYISLFEINNSTINTDNINNNENKEIINNNSNISNNNQNNKNLNNKESDITNLNNHNLNSYSNTINNYNNNSDNKLIQNNNMNPLLILNYLNNLQSQTQNQNNNNQNQNSLQINLANLLKLNNLNPNDPRIRQLLMVDNKNLNDFILSKLQSNSNMINNTNINSNSINNQISNINNNITMNNPLTNISNQNITMNNLNMNNMSNKYIGNNSNVNSSTNTNTNNYNLMNNNVNNNMVNLNNSNKQFTANTTSNILSSKQIEPNKESNKEKFIKVMTYDNLFDINKNNELLNKDNSNEIKKNKIKITQDLLIERIQLMVLWVNDIEKTLGPKLKNANISNSNINNSNEQTFFIDELSEFQLISNYNEKIHFCKKIAFISIGNSNKAPILDKILKFIISSNDERKAKVEQEIKLLTYLNYIINSDYDINEENTVILLREISAIFINYPFPPNKEIVLMIKACLLNFIGSREHVYKFFHDFSNYIASLINNNNLNHKNSLEENKFNLNEDEKKIKKCYSFILYETIFFKFFNYLTSLYINKEEINDEIMNTIVSNLHMIIKNNNWFLLILLTKALKYIDIQVIYQTLLFYYLFALSNYYSNNFKNKMSAEFLSIINYSFKTFVSSTLTLFNINIKVKNTIINQNLNQLLESIKEEEILLVMINILKIILDCEELVINNSFGKENILPNFNKDYNFSLIYKRKFLILYVYEKLMDAYELSKYRNILNSEISINNLHNSSKIYQYYSVLISKHSSLINSLTNYGFSYMTYVYSNFFENILKHDLFSKIPDNKIFINFDKELNSDLVSFLLANILLYSGKTVDGLVLNQFLTNQFIDNKNLYITDIYSEHKQIRKRQYPNLNYIDFIFNVEYLEFLASYNSNKKDVILRIEDAMKKNVNFELTELSSNIECIKRMLYFNNFIKEYYKS